VSAPVGMPVFNSNGCCNIAKRIPLPASEAPHTSTNTTPRSSADDVRGARPNDADDWLLLLLTLLITLVALLAPNPSFPLLLALLQGQTCSSALIEAAKQAHHHVARFTSSHLTRLYRKAHWESGNIV